MAKTFLIVSLVTTLLVAAAGVALAGPAAETSKTSVTFF